MLTLGELALFLRASAVRVKPALKHETQALVEHAKTEAKGFIGHERDGWAPLSEATMEGFEHPYGFHVPGKRELGFTGQVSETDPLLRTGGLRESIEAKASETASGAEGVVGSPKDVALWQECGTSRAMMPIPPRPFLAPGLMQAADDARKEFCLLGVELLTPGVR